MNFLNKKIFTSLSLIFLVLTFVDIQAASSSEGSFNSLDTNEKLTSRNNSFSNLSVISNNDTLPSDEAFIPNAFAIDSSTIKFSIRPLQGYYLYKSRISIDALNENVKIGELILPKGKTKIDEWLGEQEVYFDEVFGSAYISRATPEAMELKINLNYQGCKIDGICYMPETKMLTINVPSPASDINETFSEQAKLAQIIKNSNILISIGLFFLAGLGLALTPCVLPMVPILSGIIAGEGKDTSALRGFILALSYVLGLALVYTGAGIITAALGLQMQAIFNQPWILILFAILFVVLALGMFGYFNLQMPSSIQNRLSKISGSQKSGTLIGSFIMGALSSLIVTACVTPALIAALTVIAQTGDVLRGGISLFFMSLGMGVPLLIVGATQGKLLPKTGHWMNLVKNIFGFMMVGLAIWTLSKILSESIVMMLWSLLALVIGVSMGGLTLFKTDSNRLKKFGKGFGFLIIIYSLFLLVGSINGSDYSYKPLNNSVLNEKNRSERYVNELPFQTIKSVDDLDREIEAASALGKSVLLDFYADWCVSCIEMEKYTFSNIEVQAILSNTVWLQADVTNNDKVDKLLLKRFGVFGPPTIIFFDANGIQRRGYEIVGYMEADTFALHVQKALSITDI
ncbi:MAG: thiol:disulfide interchange protein [Gammaproteobacteria bacterium]|nr:thiol:disulfide interchange protein [Gammaproteobacteria bacterium]|tara:strand:+ start:2465 stop:4351 length:1887 start_codon:yes stop_codon:yes gene_type:complete